MKCPGCGKILKLKKKRRRKPGGGKGKGSTYERNICQRLSLWVSGLKSQDLFWRSAMSGGRANLKRRAKKAGQFRAQAGDITAIEEEGLLLIRMFCIDTKHYHDVKFDRVPFARKSTFQAIWQKLRVEGKKFGKEPMLILKVDNRGEVVVVRKTGAEKLLLKKHGLVPTVFLPQLNARVYLLRDLLGGVDFRSIRRHHEGAPRRVRLNA